MSSHHRRVLEEILTATHPKITPDEFKGLIKELGGSIASIGNGTSHKRIYLGKCIIEMYSYQLNELNEKNTENKTPKKKKEKGKQNKKSKSTNVGLVSTGGIFKEHEDKHYLCPTNIDFIRDLFDDAGITSQLLVDIDAEKKSGKDEINTNTPKL